MDAAHFVFGSFLSSIWCFVRHYIPTQSGRKRFNVLGAVNAVNKSVTVYANETYINGKSVCHLLKMLYLQYKGKPITIVLDNAKYQKCKLVRRYSKILGIELLYLPSYSPQLNIIERLWKFVKKECLYSKYYPDFPSFKDAIQDCLAKADTVHRDKLDRLLTLNFQTFKKAKILPV